MLVEMNEKQTSTSKLRKGKDNSCNISSSLGAPLPLNICLRRFNLYQKNRFLELWRDDQGTCNSPIPRRPTGVIEGRYGHVSTHLNNPTCPVTGPESRRAHNLL
ncbi:hypothetical protein YC2023_010588 [Brassica napus]